MTDSELLSLADVLRANTVKLRFFRGETYDGFADEYLQQLTNFIDAVKPILVVNSALTRNWPRPGIRNGE